MNIEKQGNQSTVIEGFLLSPPQARAWRNQTAGTMTNAVVWSNLSLLTNPEELFNQIEHVILQDLQFSTGFASLPEIALPVQVLNALIPSIDFSVCSISTDVERETQTEIARLAHLPLGQNGTPAVAVILLTEPQQEYGVLILAAAPFVADEASLLILLDRVTGGQEIPQVVDEEEPLRFQHFSEWANEEIQRAKGQEKQPFWSEEPQQTKISYIELPCSKGEPQVVATGVILDTWLECLTNFGTPEAVLLTAWGLIAGQFLPDEVETLTISRLAAGRLFDDFEEIIGPFAGRAPIILVRDATLSVAEAIATVDQSIPLHEDALIYYPDSHRINEETSGATVGFAWIAAPVPRTPFHDVNVKPATIGGNLDLIVEPMTQGRRIRVVLSGLVDRSGLAKRLVEAIVTAVKYMAETPEAPFCSVPLMGMEEYQKVVTAWNNTKQQFELPSSIPAAFRQIAAQQPASLAVVDSRGKLTFAELNCWSEHLAHELVVRGIDRETPVAVLADRSREAIVSLLAVLKAGGVYVPINPDFPNVRIEHMLKAANIKIVATEQAHIEKAQHFGLDLLIVDAQDWQDQPSERVAVEPNSTDAAYIIFTSGSTGIPNGVVVEHRSALNLWQGLKETIYRGSNPQLRVSVNAPLSFDASIKQILQLLSGNALYLVPQEVRVDPEQMLAFLVKYDLNVFDCTPSLLHLLVRAGFNQSFPGLPELILVGGEPFVQELWNLVGSWQYTQVFNVYGPTEATVNTTFAKVIGLEDEPTIGSPLPNVRVYVLDPYGRPKMIGASGELCIAGAGVARGYIAASEQLAERFANDRFSNEGGQMYWSGDRVRWRNDGSLTFLGRADRQIKFRGYRIDLGDIDSALAQHPSVNTSITVLHQAENDDASLASYVTLKQDSLLESAGELNLEIPSGHLIASINRHETMYLYQEIFVDRCYMRDGVVLPADAIVLDVGANIGMFSLFVALYAPQASIYAFEPLPPIQERLRSNIQRYANGVQIFTEGLSDRDREETFTYYPGYSMMSGQAIYADTAGEIEVIRRYLSNEQQTGAGDKELLLENIDAILAEKLRPEEHLCKLRRLGDILGKLNLERIDLLKIDVQRAEIDVLQGLDDHDWFKIKQIVLEVHDQKGGATEGHVAKLTDLLKSRGFDVRIRQDSLLEGTDRFNCYAVRPGYAETLKNIVSFNKARTVSAALTQVDSDSLRGFLSNHLPSYMLPQTIAIVDRLPLTSEGKIDARSLPTPGTPSSNRNIVVPSNAIETSLVEIWTSILKRSPIGVTDNFFQLGGDSIRAIQMQALAGDRSLSFSIQDLFQHQTIRELAAKIATEAQAKAPTTETRDEKCYAPFELLDARDQARLPHGLADAYPMTALQLSMSYLTETSGDPRVFHTATIHNIAAPFNPDALLQTLAQIMARHPILRTSFDLTNFCEPLQLVWKHVEIDVPSEDLSQLDCDRRHARFEAAIEHELSTNFDLSVAPLFRFAAFRLDSSSWALLVAEHHAVMDGWSRHVLLTEIGAVYARLIEKTAGEQLTPLKELPTTVTYRDFVFLEKKATQDPRSTAFWVNELRRAPSFRLPNHFAAKEGDRRMAEQDVPVPSNALIQLEQLSVATTLPIRSLLLAAHLLALAYHTNQYEVVTGFVTSGRPEEPGADEILGLFLNIVPCSICTRGRSPIDLAGEAFEFERRLLPHRRYPLAEIRRQCGSTADFDSLFNFTRFHSLEEYQADLIVGDVLASVPVDVDMGLAVDFQIDSSAQQLQISFQYDACRFWATDVDELVRSYAEAIDDLLVRPYQVSPRQAIAGVQSNQNQISSLVAEAFGNALGYSVEAQTGFSSAGGDSLSAVKVVSRLRQATGRMIPLSVMVGDPTIEEVAAAIILAPQQVSHKLPALAKNNSWVVRNGIVDEPRLRLFAFPPAGANASIFDDWKALLPKTIAQTVEIVAIQYPGRQARLKEAAITHIRELVSSVAEAIAPLIDRPFAMLGSSLGALVAFETARLLRADRGIEPSHLFFVCARAPQCKEPYPRFHAMTDAELIETLKSFEGVASEILENSDLLNLLLPIIRADSLVSSSYRYQHDELFKCPITVVSGSRDQSVSIEQSENWRNQTTGAFELKVIEGGHGLITSNKQALIKAISYELAD